MDNEFKDDTDDTIPTIRYSDDINTIHHVNEIIYHKILMRKTFLLPPGENGEVIRAQVKACAAQFY